MTSHLRPRLPGLGPRPRVGGAARERARTCWCCARSAAPTTTSPPSSRRSSRSGRPRSRRPTPADLGDQRAAGLLRTALRIGFRSGAGPFRSLAGIAVEPRAYQLVPLLMALRQQTVRMLISDDVGIGKTVEAGLIASELLAQGEAQGLAVLCSPALAEQWQEELRDEVRHRRRAGAGLHGLAGWNAAWTWASRCSTGTRTSIVSTDFIKSTRHRDEFVRHCPDLVIVDEAHTCVAADDAGSARQSQNQLRYELLRRVAADQQRHLLLVTATPHSGKEAAFRNLLGLLGPDLATVDLDSEAGRRAARPALRAPQAGRRTPVPRPGRTAWPTTAWPRGPRSPRTAVQGRDLQAVPGVPGAAGRRHRVRERAGRAPRAGRAGGRPGSPGGRRSRCCGRWCRRRGRRPDPADPLGGGDAASAEEADLLGAPLTSDSADNDALEGWTWRRAPTTSDGRRRRGRGRLRRALAGTGCRAGPRPALEGRARTAS